MRVHGLSSGRLHQPRSCSPQRVIGEGPWVQTTRIGLNAPARSALDGTVPLPWTSPQPEAPAIPGADIVDAAHPVRALPRWESTCVVSQPKQIAVQPCRAACGTVSGGNGTSARCDNCAQIARRWARSARDQALISGTLRKQPRQWLPSSLMRHTEMQGDGTSSSEF